MNNLSPQSTLLTPEQDGLTPVLSAEHVRKMFPIRKVGFSRTPLQVHAVEDASLALYPGKAVALVGESGSGKTTVARMMARIYEPTSGTLRFQGEAVNGPRGLSLKNY